VFYAFSRTGDLFSKKRNQLMVSFSAGHDPSATETINQYLIRSGIA
jgi:hypothetical protein